MRIWQFALRCMKAYFPIFYFLCLIFPPNFLKLLIALFYISLLLASALSTSLTQFLSTRLHHPLPHFFNRKIIIFSSSFFVPFFKMNIFWNLFFLSFRCVFHCRYTIFSYSFLRSRHSDRIRLSRKGSLMVTDGVRRYFPHFFLVFFPLAFVDVPFESKTLKKEFSLLFLIFCEVLKKKKSCLKK